MNFAFTVGQQIKVDHGNQIALATIVARSRLKTVGMFTLPDGGPFYALESGETVREAQISAAEVLPVIFRAERSGDFKGDVTAVFPTLPHDPAGRFFTVYAHVGQHGAGCLGWYQGTRAAKPEEYVDLLAELRAIYETSIAPGDDVYSLKVCQRMSAHHRRAFAAEVERLRRARAA